MGQRRSRRALTARGSEFFDLRRLRAAGLMNRPARANVRARPPGPSAVELGGERGGKESASGGGGLYRLGAGPRVWGFRGRDRPKAPPTFPRCSRRQQRRGGRESGVNTLGGRTLAGRRGGSRNHVGGEGFVGAVWIAYLRPASGHLGRARELPANPRARHAEHFRARRGESGGDDESDADGGTLGGRTLIEGQGGIREGGSSQEGDVWFEFRHRLGVKGGILRKGVLGEVSRSQSGASPLTCRLLRHCRPASTEEGPSAVEHTSSLLICTAVAAAASPLLRLGPLQWRRGVSGSVAKRGPGFGEFPGDATERRPHPQPRRRATRFRAQRESSPRPRPRGAGCRGGGPLGGAEAGPSAVER